MLSPVCVFATLTHTVPLHLQESLCMFFTLQMNQHIRCVTAEWTSVLVVVFSSTFFQVALTPYCSSQQTDDAAGASSVSSTDELLLYWTLNPRLPSPVKNTFSLHMMTLYRQTEWKVLISSTAPHAHHHFSCHELHFHLFPASFPTFIVFFFPLAAAAQTNYLTSQNEAVYPTFRLQTDRLL